MLTFLASTASHKTILTRGCHIVRCVPSTNTLLYRLRTPNQFSDTEQCSKTRAIHLTAPAVLLLEAPARRRLTMKHKTDHIPAIHSKITRRLAPLAIVAVLGIAAAACGSGSGASSGGPSTTTPSTTTGHSGGGSTSGSGGAAF
jgi:uncharacterized membrane protein YgcG